MPRPPQGVKGLLEVLTLDQWEFQTAKTPIPASATPIDAVNVGMYRQFGDRVADNAALVRKMETAR